MAASGDCGGGRSSSSSSSSSSAVRRRGLRLLLLLLPFRRGCCRPAGAAQALLQVPASLEPGPCVVVVTPAAGVEPPVCSCPRGGGSELAVGVAAADNAEVFVVAVVILPPLEPLEPVVAF